MTVNLLPCTGNCPVLTFVSRICSMKKKVPYLRIAFKANEKRREKMRFDEDHLPSNNISTYLFDVLNTDHDDICQLFETIKTSFVGYLY